MACIQNCTFGHADGEHKKLLEWPIISISVPHLIFPLTTQICSLYMLVISLEFKSDDNAENIGQIDGNLVIGWYREYRASDRLYSPSYNDALCRISFYAGLSAGIYYILTRIDHLLDIPRVI